MIKILKTSVSMIAALALAVVPNVSFAADSIRVPGQVGVDQCPAGYQSSTGIEVNASTGETFTICTGPPSAADLARQQEDLDFQNRISAAQAAAEAESRAWNAANPGMQKCVQWGPIVHANGISTSSGGVCANPVSANDAVVPELSAGVVRGEEPIVVPDPKQGTNTPMYVEISGQTGVEGCPAGYQGGNAIVVDVSSGKTTTQCWAKDAFDAWRLGGDVWQRFVSNDGAFDVQAEVDRRAKVEALKARALEVASSAAALTPGVKRCSAWDGYGESGRECAYVFKSPSSSTNVQETTAGVDREAAAAPVVASSQVTMAASIKVTAPKGTAVTLKTLTPAVCKTQGVKAISKKAGTCRISIVAKSAKGKITRTTKTVVFIK